MRIHDLSKALALLVALVAPIGGALANGTASHQVSVSIPTVLRLRLDDGAAQVREAHDVLVEVAGERVRLEPAGTRIEVRANDAWALDAHYRPTGGSAAVPLGATVDGTTWHALAHGARLTTGTATDGWRAIDVAYDLLSPVSDGTYRGVVVYTLTKP